MHKMIDFKHTVLKQSSVHSKNLKDSTAQKQYPLGSYVPKSWTLDAVCSAPDSLLFSASSMQDALVQASTSLNGLGYLVVYSSGSPQFSKKGTTINYNAVAAIVAYEDFSPAAFGSFLTDIVNGEYIDLGKSYTAVYCTDDNRFNDPNPPPNAKNLADDDKTSKKLSTSQWGMVVFMVLFILVIAQKQWSKPRKAW